MNREEIEYVVRFFHHVRKDTDLELAILKSHLLIESLTRDFLSKKIKHPQYLKNANLGPYQAILLARSLNDRNISDWAWEAALSLNSMRNDLSHNLVSEKLQSKIDEFISFVDSHASKLEGFEEDFGPFITRVIEVWLALCVTLHFDPSKVRHGNKSLLAG
jgi:hypothetical protein